MISFTLSTFISRLRHFFVETKYHHWNQALPDFITSLVGWSIIINYQLVISLFQQLMVTQLRIMEWHSSLTARQTVNVFVLTHIALPSPDDTKQKIMYRLTLREELWVSTSGITLRASSTAIPLVETHPFRGSKPVHEENCQGIKLRIAHKIKRLNSRL